MKLVTNKQIINWLKEYGLNLICLFISLIVIYTITSIIITYVKVLTTPSCEIRDIKNNNSIMYNNTYFETIKFDYYEYGYIGDKIYIELEETNN